MYVSTHNPLARMMQSQETSQSAGRHKGLQVNHPRWTHLQERPVFYQRPNFWLNTPSAYSLLLLTITVLVHWLLSQSFFLLSVEEHHLSLSPTASWITQSYALSWSAFGPFLCLTATSAFIMILVTTGL